MRGCSRALLLPLPSLRVTHLRYLWACEEPAHQFVLVSQDVGEIALTLLARHAQDFEKAGSLRDREMELKSQISAITAGAKEGEAAEQEAGEGTGPLVTDQDIANIVAQWTGIPIEKVCSLVD